MDIIELTLSLGVTFVGVFVALFLDGLIEKRKRKKRFYKLANIAFVELQSNIGQLNSFIHGIDQRVDIFIANPPGSFLKINIPDFITLINNLLNDEILIEFSSPEDISSIIQNMKNAKVCYNALLNTEKFNSINDVKQVLSSLVEYYGKLCWDLIKIINKSDVTFSPAIYQRVIQYLEKNRKKSGLKIENVKKKEIKDWNSGKK